MSSVNLITVAPLLLILVHYVADFAMQTEFVALMKAKVHNDPHGWHALIAHSMHHAALSLAVIWFLTDSISIAATAMLVTGITHGIIDYLKAVKEAFSINIDQTLHISVAIILGMAIGAFT